MELYVHIPFCAKKCSYCSFTSYTGQETFFQTYIDLLTQEAHLRKDEVSEAIDTVYIGGGTPSLLPPAILSKLIGNLQSVYDLSNAVEITVEANPGTVTNEWLKTAAASGINRISFGMQAFQNRLLKLLGRIHLFEDVVESVSMAREAGINNISLDLIFGIPTQTEEEWEKTISETLILKPEHISAYGLIPEEGTPIKRDLDNGILELPDPEEEREMYNTLIRLLSEYGYHQYEISNFSLPGYECRHNIGYWTLVPYIGLGVSAASLTDIKYSPEGMSYIRRLCPETLKDYEKMINGNTISLLTQEKISPAESRFETMMLGLRMTQGVSESFFLEKHRLPIEHCYGTKLYALEKQGLIKHEKGVWKLTPHGFDIQNSVLVELMDD